MTRPPPISPLFPTPPLSRPPRAEARRQTLLLVSDATAVEAWADEDALDQVLENLLDNALKYTPEGGQVRVGWRIEDGQRSEEHTSELQSQSNLVCRLLLEKR